MIEAAANPVSSEIWAFHDSTGSIERNARCHRPSTTSTCCSGIGSETPPRSASRASRSSPIVCSNDSVEPFAARRGALLDAVVVEALA